MNCTAVDNRRYHTQIVSRFLDSDWLTEGCLFVLAMRGREGRDKANSHEHGGKILSLHSGTFEN